MAIIQKIRDKYAKVAGGVIAISLIAFVLNDAFNGKSGNIFGGGNALAKVEGEKIEPLDFEQRVREYQTVYSLRNPNTQISDEIRSQINDQALRDLVNEKIIDKQFDKLGITISQKEEDALVSGANPSQMIQQYPSPNNPYFINNETGQFDPSRLKGFEEQLKNPPKDADPKLLEREVENWKNYKAFVIHQNKLQKFNSLVGASMYAPKFLVDFKMSKQTEMASIRLVKVPVTIIPDNEAIITDADINAYMEKHKKRFEIAQEIRGVDYVSFDVVPSSEDTVNAATALQKIKAEFETTPNTDIADFITKNSEEGYRDYYFTKKTFKSPYADTILSRPEGAVVGPYIENSSFLMVKVIEHRQMADSVKAQHILIQPSQSMDDSAAHKLADSLKLAIESGANFDTLAAKFSVDKQNNMKGGDLGYFAYGSMVPEFNEFAFMGKTGDMKVLKTQFGYHIARINDQKDFETATKLAIVVKALYPSDVTETAIYGRATEFASKYKTSKAFQDGIAAMKLQKREADNVKIQDFSIEGVGPAREMVRWMYGAKQGDVSEVITIKSPNTRYLIATLSNVQPKGKLQMNDAIKPEIENIVRAEKKAEKIIAKFKSQTTLEGIAQASGQTILSADSFTSTTPYLENIGYEPKAIGYAFSKEVKPGVLCPAMKGQDGVTYMVLVSRVPKVANPNEAAVFQQQQMMEQQQSQRTIANALQEMMMRKSNIKYSYENIR
jgi:peptidyl-prolyl cis-trans isomerase D